MMNFYNRNQFDQWIIDFQEKINYSIDSSQLTLLKKWVESSTEPLDQLFTMIGCSYSSECYLLNDKIVLKTSRMFMINRSFEKLLQHPILYDYIVPTYIYTFPNLHKPNKEHIQFLKENNKDENCFSNCLILQPKCELFLTHKDYFTWYNNNTELSSLKEYGVDLSYQNTGYLNGEVKFFDW